MKKVLLLLIVFIMMSCSKDEPTNVPENANKLRMIKKEETSGNITTYKYDNNGFLIEEKDDDDLITYQYIDGLTVSAIINGSKTTYAHIGKIIVSETDPYTTTNYVYNNNGKIIEWNYSYYGIHTYLFEYDAIGNYVKSIEKENGKIETREYDNSKSIGQTLFPKDVIKTNPYYSSVNNAIKYIDENGVIENISYTYNKQGYPDTMKIKVNGSTETTTFFYETY